MRLSDWKAWAALYSSESGDSSLGLIYPPHRGRRGILVMNTVYIRDQRPQPIISGPTSVEDLI